MLCVFGVYPVSALERQNFGVLDIGGIARFVISSSDSVNLSALLKVSEQRLALSITSLRAVGYDDPNYVAAAPLIQIKVNGTLPIVQFNGKDLLYATPEVAQFYSKTQMEVADIWAKQLQKVAEKLPYLSAENVRTYSADMMDFYIKDLPQQSTVHVAEQPVCSLVALPEKLMPSIYRSDIVYERILVEANLALADPNYDFEKIHADSVNHQATVQAGDRILIAIAPEDARFHNSNPIDLAKLWAKSLKTDLKMLTRPTAVAMTQLY